MKVAKRTVGRIFQLQFQDGDNLFEEFEAFVREENVRNASITIFGALWETDMLSGFTEIVGNSAKLRFNDPREFVGLGNISWPEKPPAVLGNIEWKEPKPYIHIHFAISGGPFKPQEINVGHLSNGKVKGVMAEIVEFI